MLHLVILLILISVIQKKYFFGFEFVHELRVQPCWSALYQITSEKQMFSWLVTYLILLVLLHMLALFITSLIQTAGCNMAAVTVLFS